ncbi:GT-D fold domain-containing glycosyltransferase [Arcticibacter eurypsychrophilus]|uniref:GT-D fold domain-containing glycosyltransferase n=1 Tax=Arcticibacter eurypsychrophilus TaxID=1434752 RepID=UPI0014817677|nr:GT-D fold domain-containing glycosyltransferase [Arcticibacter eurypsychrophilus]
MKNILFLARYDIKDKFLLSDTMNLYMDNIKYEIEDDVLHVKRPKIATPHTTIDRILNDRASLVRFGDGEFELLNNRPIAFQANSIKLAERLSEVLESNVHNILVGLPFYYWNTVNNCNPIIKDFVRRVISKRRGEYEKHIVFDKQYYSTECTQLYMTYSEEINLFSYFEKIKNLWKDRDITIIQGKGILSRLKYDIFDCAKSKQYIYAPAKNAFHDYELLLAEAKNIDLNRLVLIILGPTATILSFDLAKLGYQALDLGHIAKDFDFFMKGTKKDSNSISSFYSPD